MWWLLACVSPAPDPDVAVATTGAPTTTDTAGGPDTTTPADTAGPTDSGPEDDGLVGVPVDPPRDPPTFEVLDQNGVARTEAWLPGHPTVLWFFREAEGAT